MRRDLPPLASVRVFEAAARHASFTKAAAELAMTQAAVSYQVRVLEDRVGHPLFVRQARRVVLTEAGRRLLVGSTEALDALAAAFADARGHASDTLSLSVLPTFGATWLAANLGRFQIAHPQLAVRIELGDAVTDFGRGEIDAGIRSGARGNWAGLDAHPLFPAVFTPMLSPALLDRLGGLREPADLLNAPILEPSDPWWDQWFEIAGVAGGLPGPRRASSFNAQYMERVAAVAGHGVAIMTPFFCEEELASGRLVQPFPIVGGSDVFYWFCYPHTRRNLPKIRLFRDWLLAEFPEGRTDTVPTGAAPS